MSVHLVVKTPCPPALPLIVCWMIAAAKSPGLISFRCPESSPLSLRSLRAYAYDYSTWHAGSKYATLAG